jgi:hypothetical protein
MDNITDPELQEFIRRCRKIVEVLANAQTFPFGFAREGIAYDDDDIMIACDPQSPSLEITIKPPIQPAGQHNPVIYVTEEGELIRHHGEWRYGQAKVDALYAEITPE